MSFRRPVLALLATSALLLTACGGGEETAASGDGPQTLTEGTLTIATGEPAYSPWVEDDDPASGEGFESAVAYAVAEKLGFEADQVAWVRTPFDAAIAPGPKDFDLNLQQFSATDERRQVVDLSVPYYTTSQAVVSLEGNAGADATSTADFEGLAIGAAAGSTSIQAAQDDLGVEPQIFNSNEDTVQALVSGQIDGYVTDLPTALFNAGVQLGEDGGVVVGQLEGKEGGDEFAFLLEKDSPLTPEVDAALEELRADGTLDELEQKWLSDSVDVPVLG